MSEKELYRQKVQAKLDEWKADLDKLRARASAAGADAKLELNEQIQRLEAKIKEGEKKLAELADTSEDAWDSVKHGFESAWEALKASFKEAADKFKK